MAAETGAAAFGAGKLLGSIGGATGAGAALATVVVMCMTLPKSPREWAVGLISTVTASLAGGAVVVIKFGLLEQLQGVRSDAELFFALLGLLGLTFGCGLPGWAVVRWTFRWMEKRQGKDIAEVATDAVSDVKHIAGGGNG